MRRRVAPALLRDRGQAPRGGRPHRLRSSCLWPPSQPVGWVERSETHRAKTRRGSWWASLRSTHPTFDYVRPRSALEIGRRLTSDPNRSSLGLLPSGPDPVGEWLVHRQPPGPYIGGTGGDCKRRGRPLSASHAMI